MLEPAIIEASMNLDIEHILSDSEEKKPFVFHNHNISIIWYFFQIWSKGSMLNGEFSAPFFLRNIENNQAFFVSDSPKSSTCNTFVLYFKKIRV